MFKFKKFAVVFETTGPVPANYTWSFEDFYGPTVPKTWKRVMALYAVHRFIRAGKIDEARIYSVSVRPGILIWKLWLRKK